MRRSASVVGAPLIASLLALVLVILAAPSATAIGYKRSGSDRDDINTSNADIRRTTERVWEGAAGHRWYSLWIRAYEPFGTDWAVSAYIDASGGPRWDVNINFLHFSDVGCALNWRNGGGDLAPMEQEGDRARCVFPLSELHADKHIRWRVRSADEHETSGSIDRAPDAGFYS